MKYIGSYRKVFIPDILSHKVIIMKSIKTALFTLLLSSTFIMYGCNKRNQEPFIVSAEIGPHCETVEEAKFYHEWVSEYINNLPDTLKDKIEITNYDPNVKKKDNTGTYWNLDMELRSYTVKNDTIVDLITPETYGKLHANLNMGFIIIKEDLKKGHSRGEILEKLASLDY